MNYKVIITGQVVENMDGLYTREYFTDGTFKETYTPHKYPFRKTTEYKNPLTLKPIVRNIQSTFTS